MLDDGGGKERLTEDDYRRISVVLLYYAINLRDLCSASPASPSNSPGNHQFYLLALSSLHPDEDGLFLSASETESILQRINQHYHPTNRNASPEQQVGGFISPFFLMRLLLSSVSASVNISQLIPNSASILPTSLRTLGCRKILVPLRPMCPDWPRPSSATSCRVAASGRRTSLLLLSSPTTSSNPSTAQVTFR